MSAKEETEEVMKKSLEEYCAFMKKDELRKG